MTSDYPKLTLRNGVEMPALGLGVYQSGPDETLHAVSTALATGYRLIDTAAAYGNEAQVGEAVRQSAVPPGDVFVTTKLWISDYGYDEALHGFERSMRKLGLQTLDLYLLHQPMSTEWSLAAPRVPSRRRGPRIRTRHRRGVECPSNSRPRREGRPDNVHLASFDVEAPPTAKAISP